MKKNLLLLAVVIAALCSLSYEAQAQYQAIPAYGVSEVPTTLFAGTSMASRTVSTSLDDTTKTFTTQGLAAVYVRLLTATNDSARVRISAQYRLSAGTNFTAFEEIDSLVTTGTVGVPKVIALPARFLGAYQVRVRQYGNANVNTYSVNPSTTLRTEILRVPYNREDARVR